MHIKQVNVAKLSQIPNKLNKFFGWGYVQWRFHWAKIVLIQFLTVFNGNFINFCRSLFKDSKAIASKLSLNHSTKGIMWWLAEMDRAKVISSLPYNLCSVMNSPIYDLNNVRPFCMKALALVFYPHMSKLFLTIQIIEFR